MLQGVNAELALPQLTKQHSKSHLDGSQEINTAMLGVCRHQLPLSVTDCIQPHSAEPHPHQSRALGRMSILLAGFVTPGFSPPSARAQGWQSCLRTGVMWLEVLGAQGWGQSCSSVGPMRWA